MSPLKRGADLTVGDCLMVGGSPRRIDSLEPYIHPTIREAGWRIARSAGDWSMTIFPDLELEVS